MPYGYLGVSQNWGYLFGGPYNKDYSILGSILGSPYFGKLPFILETTYNYSRSDFKKHPFTLTYLQAFKRGGRVSFGEVKTLDSQE